MELWRKITGLLIAALIALAGSTALADEATGVESVAPPEISTAAFADRNEISGARLSPDGSKLLVRIRRNGKNLLAWFDADTRVARGGVEVGKDSSQLEWYRWAGSDKVIFSISRPGTYFDQDVRLTRLLGWNVATDQFFYIGLKNPTVIGDDVLHIADDGSHLLLAAQRSPYDWPQVYRFAIEEDAKGETVQRQKDGVWDWYADNEGVVRIGTAWSDRKLKIF